MPETNLLLSAVTIEDCVVRLFRNWLGEQATRRDRDPSADSEILWVDSRRNVGLKIRVRERKRPGLAAPVLIRSDESMPVSYGVDIEGMHPSLLARISMLTSLELHIRTTSVLLTLEQSLQEQQSNKQAIIFTQSLALG